MEGAFRKWVFPSGSIAKYLCYFSKDILFGLLVVTTSPRASINGSDLLKKYLTWGILLFVLGAIISSAAEINWVGAVLSTRALLCLPVVALLALPRLGGIKLEGLALVIGILTVGNAALGYMQYHAPPEALINHYATDTFGPADMFEENVRAAGTFSYITGYGNMATVGAWAGLTLLCLAAGRLRYVIAGWAIYLAALVCALVSISRATVLVVGLIFVIFVLSGRQGLANLLKAGAALVVIFLLAYASNLSSKFTDLADKVMERNEMAGDSFGERTLDPITEIGVAFDIAPMGDGFGTQQVGGVYAETGLMKFRNFENQFPRLVIETGILGLAGFFITWMGLVLGMFNARNNSLSDGLRRVCVLSMFVICMLFFQNVVFNHTASFFAWWILAVTIAATSARSEAVVAPHG
jgi:O-Antigen ligase